jgi:hypothetical protein
VANILLDPPKEVFQPKDSYKCWAAALVSWLYAEPKTGGASWVKSVDDAIKLFAPHSGALGGLDIPREFDFMAQMVGMDYLVFPKHKMSLITGTLIHSKLRKGHVYIVVSGGTVTSSVTLAHAAVIWAMAHWDSANPSLAVMDPLYGWVSGRPLSYYRSAANAIVGWPY